MFFGLPLVQGHSLAYRDSARFYYRQFEWNQLHWQRGEVPLWNPQENLGAPVIAEATSSVFYPLQILFHIPGIEFPTAFLLYAAIHVYLAGVGSFFLARELKCRHLAALFGAFSYSMSGTLVFQTCNIVFLVGGCWLPFCLWMSHLLARKPGMPVTGGLAIFLALPVLGGDPQTAYHVGILAGLLLLWRFAQGRRRENQYQLKRSVGFHALAAVVAMGLCAVQVLPSWEATRKSSRSQAENARSLWESGNKKLALQGLVGQPVPGTHHDHLYQFSQTPLSIVSLFWPNVEGEVVGRNDRWTETFPASNRTWTSSLYCGLLTTALFLSSLIRKSRRTSTRWLKSGFVVFAIGSLGWFGCGWLIQLIGQGCFGVDPAKSPVGAPTGGVYWLFVVFLPGYVNFRYPAKLFIVATLLFCLLAAREFELLTFDRQITRARKFLVGLFWCSIGVLVMLWLTSIPINYWLGYLSRTTTSEFGPFDSEQAWSTVIWALLHSIVVSVVAITLINQGIPRRWLPIALLILTLLDLVLANQRLVITARSSLWRRSREVEALVDNGGNRLVRIYRTDSMTWSTKSDWLQKYEPNRLEQIVDFEVQTLMPRHHLVENLGTQKIGLLESFRTLDDRQFETVMALIKGFPGIRTNDSYDVSLAPNPVSLGVLGCRYLLIPNWGSPTIPSTDRAVELKRAGGLLIENPYYLPRFRISRNIKPIRAIHDLNDWLSDEKNRSIVFRESRFGNPDKPDLVETDNDEDFSPTEPSQSEPDSRIRVLSETDTLIDLEVTADSGVLVVADQFDDDWRAYRVDEDGSRHELSVLRTNLIMRGISLSSSDQATGRPTQRIQLVYRPRWFVRGSWISLFTLTLCVLGGCWVAWYRRMRK